MSFMIYALFCDYYDSSVERDMRYMRGNRSERRCGIRILQYYVGNKSERLCVVSCRLTEGTWCVWNRDYREIGCLERNRIQEHVE